MILDSAAQLRSVVNTFPELLMDALSINCFFDGKEFWSRYPENSLRLFLGSKIKLDFLSLSNFLNSLTIPPVVKRIKLLNTVLTSYEIPGVKKMDINLAPTGVEDQTYTFSSDLKELQIKTKRSIKVSLPPNLWKLVIGTHLSSVDFVSEELLNLKVLSLSLPNIEFFHETGIVALNLTKLVLTNCGNLSNYDELRQFHHLKHLFVENSSYPIDLFSEDSFPKLDKLEYRGCYMPDLEGSSNTLLKFPTKLKELKIEKAGFEKVDFSNLVLPTGLQILNLRGISFNGGYLSDGLRRVYIRTSKVTLKSNFRIPHTVENILLEANYLILHGLNFMCHLSTNLQQLHLIANDLGKIHPTTKMVAWPLSLNDFVFQNLNIDNRTLELLNLRESRLEKIDI